MKTSRAQRQQIIQRRKRFAKHKNPSLINATREKLEQIIEVGGCFGDFAGYKDKECKDCAFWSQDPIVQCAFPAYGNESLVDKAKELLCELEKEKK